MICKLVLLSCIPSNKNEQLVQNLESGGRMRKIATITLAIVLVVGTAVAQLETWGSGWETDFELTTHSTNPYHAEPDGGVLVTDEVTAGWDIDQDGNLEFLVLTDHSNPNGGGVEYLTGASLYLYEANASGGYDLAWSWWDTTMTTGGASFPVHTVGDLDGDGNQEILMGVPTGSGWPQDGSNAPRFFVFEGPNLPSDPTATWTLGASAGSNTRPSGMAVGDYDGDGAQEVAVAYRSYSDAAVGDAMQIFSLNGDFSGTFTQFTTEVLDTLTDVNSIYAVDAGDLDGDGMEEALFSSFSRDKLYIFEGNGTADEYNMNTVVGDPNWLGGLHACYAYDADGDGADELFVGNGQQNFVIMDGVTDAMTADSSMVYAIDGPGTSFRGMAVGDFDWDGNVDVFSGDNYLGSVTRWEWDGVGTLTDPASWEKTEVYQQDTSGTIRTYYVAFGGAAGNGGDNPDLNGDGHPDLAIGFEDGDSSATSYVVILSNTDVVAVAGEFGRHKLDSYKLAQNYPNPFNPSTSIEYTLSATADVTLNVYDLRGNLVNTLVSDQKEAGAYSVSWNGMTSAGKQVASGIYIYTMTANGVSVSKQMTFLK